MAGNYMFFNLLCLCLLALDFHSQTCKCDSINELKKVLSKKEFSKYDTTMYSISININDFKKYSTIGIYLKEKFQSADSPPLFITYLVNKKTCRIHKKFYGEFDVSKYIAKNCTITEATKIAIATYGKLQENDTTYYEEDSLNFSIYVGRKRKVSYNGNQVTMLFGGGSRFIIDKKTCKIKQRWQYQ